MSSQELWQWVHFSYGEELGLTSDDDDYVAPILIDEDVKSKHSDQSIKYLEKSFEKGDLCLQEIASDLLIEEENSVNIMFTFFFLIHILIVWKSGPYETWKFKILARSNNIFCQKPRVKV